MMISSPITFLVGPTITTHELELAATETSDLEEDRLIMPLTLAHKLEIEGERDARENSGEPNPEPFRSVEAELTVLSFLPPWQTLLHSRLTSSGPGWRSPQLDRLLLDTRRPSQLDNLLRTGRRLSTIAESGFPHVEVYRGENSSGKSVGVSGSDTLLILSRAPDDSPSEFAFSSLEFPSSRSESCSNSTAAQLWRIPNAIVAGDKFLVDAIFVRHLLLKVSASGTFQLVAACSAK